MSLYGGKSAALFAKPFPPFVVFGGCGFQLVGCFVDIARLRGPPFVYANLPMALVLSPGSTVCFNLLKGGFFYCLRPLLDEGIVVMCNQCCSEEVLSLI